MFNNYDIEIITKTINKVTDIYDGAIEFHTSHNNEGIIEIRIYDVEDKRHHVKSVTFNEPIKTDQEAFNWIQMTINEYEESRKCYCGNDKLTSDSNGKFLCNNCTAQYSLKEGRVEPDFLCECGGTSWQPVEDVSNYVKCNFCGVAYDHDPKRNNPFVRVIFG
ncbi:hypothetical protein QTG56_24415 (plasmid) [Rossellomorea sp. AcN35-11]|nr:hypothetical protein [Rossellomorea aquimaris]WJV31779.1 hypothetical protein QTG56_24415 [Rossellomorea sp. AcN35-11]